MKRNQQQGSRSHRRHGKRMLLMQLGLIMGLGLVVGRLVYVQNAFGKRLSAAATSVQDGTAIKQAPRGSLLDSQGQPLAYDVPAFMLDVNRAALPDKTAFANLLAKTLGVAPSVLAPYLQGSGWMQWPHPVLQPVKSKIEAAMQTAIDKARPGESIGAYVTFTPTEQRFYPDGTLAANTIGYVNSLGVGQSGLEAQYNQWLTGKDGSYTFQKQGNGELIETSIHVTQQPKPGDNVELNINGTIQGYVEDQINKIVQQYHPEHATIIVMRPQTGAILAMSSRPSYDPNTYWNASQAALSTNWAVNASFEPGSTFKIMVFAAGLATHAIGLNQTFMSGHKIVDGVQINDWNWNGWGRISFKEALQKSSNVGLATVALKLGWPRMLQYMKNFGYLAPTGIDLPDEASSQVFAPSMQGPVQLATSGFGQGIAVTPLQQMSALSAILNGGNVMQPEVAKAIVNPTTGKVVKAFSPTVTHAHVVPVSIAQTVKNTMISDVTKGGPGIDQVAYLPGYEVGGKTGTAQIVNAKTGQYYANRYAVSFIGFAPGWDPQVEVYVNVYYPDSPAANTWGSTIAAPAATAILQECMQVFHIAPNSGHKVNLTGPNSSTKTHYVTTPQVAGQSTAKATLQLQHAGLKADVIGTGTIAKQWPQAGVSVPAGSKVYLLPSTPGKSGLVMPNLVGASMREAGDILAAAGVNINPSGTGFATYQSVKAGAKLKPGSTIQVTFAQPSTP